MELRYVALMIVGVCLPVHVVRGADDSSCYYEDAGEWSACYPRTKQQTMAQFLVDGDDTCPQTKSKTRSCTPEIEEPEEESNEPSCQYENAGEWSACYPRTKQQTMAQFLVDGDDSCPQTKSKTRSCTPNTSEESDDDTDEVEAGQEDEDTEHQRHFSRSRSSRKFGGHHRNIQIEEDHNPGKKTIQLSDLFNQIFGHRGRGNRGGMNREIGSRGHGNRGGMNREIGSRGHGNRGEMNRETGSRGHGNRGEMNRETGSRRRSQMQKSKSNSNPNRRRRVYVHGTRPEQGRHSGHSTHHGHSRYYVRYHG